MIEYSVTQASSFLGNEVQKVFSQWPHPLPAHEFRGIHPTVVAANVAFISDLEFDPLTQEVLATPINDFLGWPYSRFGHQARPNLIAAQFGDWQLKIFGADGEGPRTGVYRAPKGIGDVPFLPKIPRETVEAIALRYELTPPTEAEDFWDWFKAHPQIPLIVTEGAKKALAAISEGWVALALFGCCCGVTELTIKPELLPYVEGREVRIAFDRDAKPETRHKVFKATKKLGNALTYHAKAKVKVMIWDSAQGKGLDDLIAHDPQLFHQAIAQDFRRWKLAKYTDLTPLVSLTVNVPNLTALAIPPEESLICLKSPKKTYKTELLAGEMKKAINAGIPVFVFSHREQLVKELARRFCVEYRTELTPEGKLFGYALCVDSAHPKANPPLQGDAPEWEEAWIVFDECEQVFWHLLNSTTCQENRPAILKTITSLVNRASRVFLADADLTRVSVDYINSMRDKDCQFKPYLVVNEYQHSPRQLYTFDQAKCLLTKILELLADGQKLIIHTGGQIEKSLWGTTNLESLITQRFSSLKVLRIDKVTVSDPTHPAYGCIANLNQILPHYDVVIASPTIETGVSIEVEHFDGVCCFASGSQTVEAIGQALERVRTDIPRYLWATEKAHWNNIGSGSTDVYKILTDDKKLAKVNGYLAKIDDFYADDDLDTRHRQTWAIMAARHNLGFQTYRESIYDLLASEFILQAGTLEASEAEIALAKQEAESTAVENHRDYCQRVAKAELLSDTDYQAIKEKRAKTASERLSEQKTAIAHRYATEEVTPDLVEQDSDVGWYRQLRLHYFLTLGSEFLLSRDYERMSQLAKTGKVFSPDGNRACLAATVKALELLNIQQFFEPEKTWTRFDLEDWHDDLIQKRSDVKLFTGVTIKADKKDKNNSPIRCAQRLLAKLGLDLVCCGRARVNGEPTKFYKLATLDPDGRTAIFERWLARDRGVEKSVVWNAIDNISSTNTLQTSSPESQEPPQPMPPASQTQLPKTIFKSGDYVYSRDEKRLKLQILTIHNQLAILRLTDYPNMPPIQLDLADLILQEAPNVP